MRSYSPRVSARHRSCVRIPEPVPPELLENLTKDAAAHRAELSQTFLTGETVQTLLGIDAAAPTAWRTDH